MLPPGRHPFTACAAASTSHTAATASAPPPRWSAHCPCASRTPWRDGGREVGVELVKTAMVYGKHLSGNAYKVLISMSMSALDKPKEGRPPGLYWGGWDALALALGYPDAQRGGTGHRAVRRAIKELRDGKHVTPMLIAARGSRQSYLVHPGGIAAPVDNSTDAASGSEIKGDQNGPVKGDQNGPVKGDQNGPQCGAKMAPPRKELGSTGLTQDSITHPPASTTGGEPVPVENADEKSDLTNTAHRYEGDRDDFCEACGQGWHHLVHYRHRLRAV